MKHDLTEKRFGSLTAIKRVVGSKWECLCDCGNKRVVATGHLNAGYFKCCGCTVRHGMTRTKEHNSYHNMKSRCLNKSNKRYVDYGGRGITICDSWKDSFIEFYRDMGDCPDGFQLERIDNDKGYSKDNCVWISPKENIANRRSSKIYTVNGKEYSSSIDAAIDNDVSTSTIYHWCGLRKRKDKTTYPAKDNCSYRFAYEETQDKSVKKGLINVVS